MLSDYKSYIGIAAIIIAVISYVPYFRNIFAGKTKPHAFTWLIWGTLNAIAFAGALQDGGGAGVWAVGFTAIILFTIFVISLNRGEKDIKLFDWLCLFGATLSLIVWYISKDPLTSIIIITVIDAIGFMPTFRKSIQKPWQETMFTYSMSALKYLLVILALEKYTLVTTLFPSSLVIMNALFVLLLIVRRRQIAR